jgi:hypothetical protein
MAKGDIFLSFTFLWITWCLQLLSRWCLIKAGSMRQGFNCSQVFAGSEKDLKDQHFGLRSSSS